MKHLDIPRYKLTYRYQRGPGYPWQVRSSDFYTLRDARIVIQRVKNDFGKFNLQMLLEKSEPIWTHRGNQVA